MKQKAKLKSAAVVAQYRNKKSAALACRTMKTFQGAFSFHELKANMHRLRSVAK